MKKIFTLLGLIGLFGLQSCTGPEGPPGNPGYNVEAEVYEITNVNFLAANDYSVFRSLPHTIYSSDMVLVYRLSGVDGGEDVWKLQPENYYFTNGTLDFGYDFDFTRFDFNIYMNGNDLESVDGFFRLDQIFRIVIIPGYLSNKSAIDLKDYNAVMKAYNLNDTSVKTLKHK